jgi:hypothetical protein
MTTVSRSDNRWVAVGHSNHPEARVAGAAAAEAALHRDDAKLLVVFASDSYDLPALLDAVAKRAGDTPLIGCSTAGQISPQGPTDASVVITALGGDGFAAATSAAQQSDGNQREAGASVANAVSSLNGKPHRIMLLLSDALAGDQQQVIRGAYSVLGATVPLVGACAGDDFKMTSTYQFHGREVLSGGVVGAALVSDAPFGIGVSHGWTKVGEPVLVTRSSGNRVYELDDRPALDVYLERLGAPAEAHADPVAFGDFGMHHPLGLDRRNAEQGVRFVAGADFDERSLTMIAEVPQGGLAWFMTGDDRSVQAATDAACESALTALGGCPPIGLLAFDCAARRGVLGDGGIGDEVRRIAGHAGVAPTAGFYSYGEIARTTGVTGFHNQTLVVLALS